MQEKETKTSPKQRVAIAIIAVFMLVASVAIYIAIIISANSSSTGTTSKVDEAKVAELTKQYEEKSKQYEELANGLSSKYIEKFSKYRSEVKSYNASSINEKTTVSTKDLKIGSGEEISTDTTGYGAYYIGWCSDETVFDSSFDNYESPSKLNAPIVVEADSLIEGWYLGVDGMKVGGTRIVSIPGKLAYGDSQEICGGTNSPLKFLIMTVDLDDDFKKMTKEMSDLYMQMIYAQYGMESAE